MRPSASPAPPLSSGAQQFPLSLPWAQPAGLAPDLSSLNIDSFTGQIVSEYLLWAEPCVRC